MSIYLGQDIIDSRDVDERIEELEEQRTPRFVAGWNLPGFMPDMDPAEFDNAEDAREYVEAELREQADQTDDEAQAVEFERAADALEEQDPEFSVQVGSYVYWVTEDGTMGLDEEEEEELEQWRDLKDQLEGYSDWMHGATLIEEDHFEAYAQDLAEDIGAIDRNANWPLNHIDWAAAARELQMDYTSAEVAGHTYWVR